ncbi:MAG: DUF2071 domain-containing protein [Pirellulaceae bacterium]
MASKSPRLKTQYKCQWREVVALNFEIDSRVIKRHIPKSLSIDRYNDHTLLTMMAKTVRRLRPWGFGPGLVRSFEEIDFRTYVSCEINGQLYQGHILLKNLVSSKMAGRILHFLTGQESQLVTARRATSGFEEARRDALPSADYRWEFDDSESHFMVKARDAASKSDTGSKEEFVLQQTQRFLQTPRGLMVQQIRQTPWMFWSASSGSFDCDARMLLGEEFRRALTQPKFVLLSRGGKVTVYKPEKPGSRT